MRFCFCHLAVVHSRHGRHLLCDPRLGLVCVCEILLQLRRLLQALQAGVVQYVAEASELRSMAVEVAAGVAHLGANRETLGLMKERIYGDNAAINGLDGPASMLRNPDRYAHVFGDGLAE